MAGTQQWPLPGSSLFRVQCSQGKALEFLKESFLVTSLYGKLFNLPVILLFLLFFLFEHLSTSSTLHVGSNPPEHL